MKKIFLTILAGITMSAFPVFAKFSFGAIDINKNDELLFTLRQNTYGVANYSSLFYTKIKDGEAASLPELITYYPEQLDLLDGGNILQIRNRYGTARYNYKNDKIQWVKKVSGIPENLMPTVPYCTSPDGKYLCRIEKTEICSGRLILERVSDGSTAVLDEKALNSYEEVPVKWSPDSSILIYEKNNGVYFCNAEAVIRNVEIEERFRLIGRGTINSIAWASEKYLAYADDCLLFRINTNEMYTVGLYAGIIGQGKAIGRLPFQFNSLTDKLFVNSDGTSIVIIQNNRLFTYLTIQSLSCEYMDVIYSRPYTDSTASLKDAYVFWDKENHPVLWQEKLPYLGALEKGSVYRLDNQAKLVLEISDSGKPYISPDGSRVAFFSENEAYVYDINSWQCIAELEGERVNSILWVNKNQLYVGGERSIRLWNLLSNNSETICLTSSNACYWDDVNNTIISGTLAGDYYRFNKNKGTWTPVSAPISTTASTQNGRYRVFAGSCQNQRFENGLYIRSLSAASITKAVYPQTTERKDDLKKAALIFDAYDNADGLPQILAILKKYNVKATFFFNGEFIRRYPMETKQIVTNGHNSASMFFTTSDLTDSTFTMTEDFIRRGLARNEDEFFQCTGKELDLFWHAPEYKDTEIIKNYGKAAGYSYINNNFRYASTDTQTVKPEKLINEYYTMLKYANYGVIPVTVGYSQGFHEDPLYNHLDVLISALLDGGYELVELNQL